MAKSQQTFNKIEKEKARLKKREEKKKKKEARKAEQKESGNQGIQFAYVDFNGNLTDTPPNPEDKIKVKADNIVLGIPKKDDSDIEAFDPIRKGKVYKSATVIVKEPYDERMESAYYTKLYEKTPAHPFISRSQRNIVEQKN